MQKLEQKFNSSSSTKAKKGGSGSAFFINSKGNIVTNNHVAEVCSGNIKIIHNNF
jgi:S1-C subfamily serine protease